MAAVNYYLGLKRGKQGTNAGDVVIATSTQGTAVDVELRIQINDGVNPTNIKNIDVLMIIEAFEYFVTTRGVPGSLGTDLPAN